MDFAPRLRDTLSREFLIREGIAHAKAAKDAKPRRWSGRRRGTRRKIGYWGLDNGDWGLGRRGGMALLRSEPRRLGRSYAGLSPYYVQSRQAR